VPRVTHYQNNPVSRRASLSNLRRRGRHRSLQLYAIALARLYAIALARRVVPPQHSVAPKLCIDYAPGGWLTPQLAGTSFATKPSRLLAAPAGLDTGHYGAPQTRADAGRPRTRTGATAIQRAPLRSRTAS
jgi:hypothetical protein